MAAKRRKTPEFELTPELIADVVYKANKPVKLDEILAMLKVKRHSKRDVEFLLHALELDGRLIRSRGSWFPPKNRPLVQGLLSIQRSGAGFVIPENSEKGDVFIAPHDLQDAWDGDLVEVAIMPNRQGPNREGRITRIIERSQKLLPAFAVRKQGNEWLATPQQSGLQVLFKVDVSEMGKSMATPVPPSYPQPAELPGNVQGQGQKQKKLPVKSNAQGTCLDTVEGQTLKAAKHLKSDGDSALPSGMTLGQAPARPLARTEESLQEVATSQTEDSEGTAAEGLVAGLAEKLAERLGKGPAETPMKSEPAVKIDDLLLIQPLEKLGPGLWAAKAVMNLYNEESPAAQELLAKISHGIPMEFPPAVIQEVAAMPENPTITEETLHSRKDLRDIPFVTIDGADAKDFDDAVYVEKVPQGYRLLVAIADVSYYVTNASAIDNEARRRGNSYYFPLSVEPMLPEVLSNGLCSLKPLAPRLAVVADMTFSEAGVEMSASFCTAVVESKARLTYRQVYAAAVENNEDMQRALQAHMPMLDDAFALATILGRQRSQRGSLDFDLPEAQFVFDDNGEVADIVARKSTRANNLIEEFMIAANEAVARFLTNKKRHLLYRVHEAPDMEKLEALKNFILQTHLIDLPQGLQGAGSQRGGRGSRHGFTQKKTESTPPSPQEFKAILRAARGTPQEYTVNRLLLRAMMQARYDPDNLGHFGLASTCYCHFTSPIRRYADLVVHRALKAALGLAGDVVNARNDTVGGACLAREPQTVWAREKQAVKGVDFEAMEDSAVESLEYRESPTPLNDPRGEEASALEKSVGKQVSSSRTTEKRAPKTSVEKGSPASKRAKLTRQGRQNGQGEAREILIQRLEDIAEHINHTERSAMDAERETHKRLSALYLLKHVGESFDGVVSGVTDFGIFVELSSCLCEGMVRLSSLDDDYYHYLQDRQMLRGERTGRQFSIGMPVRVEIVDVSLQRFEVTLAVLAEDENANGEGGAGKGGRQKRFGPQYKRTRDSGRKEKIFGVKPQRASNKRREGREEREEARKGTAQSSRKKSPSADLARDGSGDWSAARANGKFKEQDGARPGKRKKSAATKGGALASGKKKASSKRSKASGQGGRKGRSASRG